MPRKRYTAPAGMGNEEREKYKVAIRRGYCQDYGSPEWKHSFVGRFLSKYPNRTKVLDLLKELCGHTPEWEDMTDTLLRDFKDSVSDSMCASSEKVTLARLKSVLSDYDYILPSRNFRKILSCKGEPSEAVFLTEDEVSAIDAYEPENDIERHVKRLFMIGCYTMARHSDCERLTDANVEDGWLNYVSQKTKVKTKVPVHRNLMKYLNEADDMEVNDFVYNDTIREICRKCGIDREVTIFRRGHETTAPKYEFISSHTARRSGATNVYLRGGEILQVSRLMGHTNVHTTQRYLVGNRELSDEVMGFFNN